MASHADAHGAEASGAVGAAGEVVEDGGGVGVVGRDGLAVFQFVAAIRASLVICEYGARGLELVVDLRAGDDVAVMASW